MCSSHVCKMSLICGGIIDSIHKIWVQFQRKRACLYFTSGIQFSIEWNDPYKHINRLGRDARFQDHKFRGQFLIWWTQCVASPLRERDTWIYGTSKPSKHPCINDVSVYLILLPLTSHFLPSSHNKVILWWYAKCKYIMYHIFYECANAAGTGVLATGNM
jgi:hypothetical protein